MPCRYGNCFKQCWRYVLRYSFNNQSVEKPIFFEKGGAGAKPPTGTRGGSPSNIAPSHGEGVWGFGKDAEIERPKALQDAKPTKRSYRDREFALFL